MDTNAQFLTTARRARMRQTLGFIMADKVRFAYVGAGFIAQTIHLPNFAALPECEFVALAEARPALGREVAARYGIGTVYSSHEEICADDSVQAVGVSGPYALQGRVAHDLLRAGKTVFMEKPMAVSLARVQSLVDASEGGNRLMVGYMKRYDAGNIALKRHVSQWRTSGEMGRILLARNHGFCGNWTYAQDPNIALSHSDETPPPSPTDAECPDWLPAQRRDSYLNYLQQWTHNVNLLRFLLDDTARTARVGAVELDADGFTGLVVLDIGGTRAVVESGASRFHAWEEHTQIYFEGGYLKTQAPALMQKEVPATVEIYRAAQGDGRPQKIKEFAPPSWSYREEARAFLRGAGGGEPFQSNALDTLHDVALFEDIYRVFLKGRGEI